MSARAPTPIQIGQSALGIEACLGAGLKATANGRARRLREGACPPLRRATTARRRAVNKMAAACRSREGEAAHGVRE